jgi:hypothetical protein
LHQPLSRRVNPDPELSADFRLGAYYRPSARVGFVTNTQNRPWPSTQHGTQFALTL